MPGLCFWCCECRYTRYTVFPAQLQIHWIHICHLGHGQADSTSARTRTGNRQHSSRLHSAPQHARSKLHTYGPARAAADAAWSGWSLCHSLYLPFAGTATDTHWRAVVHPETHPSGSARHRSSNCNAPSALPQQAVQPHLGDCTISTKKYNGSMGGSQCEKYAVFVLRTDRWRCLSRGAPWPSDSGRIPGLFWPELAPKWSSVGARHLVREQQPRTQPLHFETAFQYPWYTR